jgi:hypothetical protein
VHHVAVERPGDVERDAVAARADMVGDQPGVCGYARVRQGDLARGGTFFGLRRVSGPASANATIVAQAHNGNENQRLRKSTMADNGRPTRFYFLLTFWGEKFRKHLCRFILPSLLAPGNIPALRYPRDAKFLIVTTKADWEALRAEPIYAHLREQIDVEFIWGCEESPFHHKYLRMARGHRILAEACFEDRAIGINLAADSVFADGCVAEAQRLALDEGHDVVLCPAIRFDMEGVEGELERAGLLVENQAFSLKMRDAVALGLRHLHPESLASDWQAPNFARLHREHQRRYLLTCCFWRVPGEDGLCIVTHNWAPFVVNYAALGAHDSSTLDGRAIDGEYIFRNFPQYTRAIHVVTDSDSLFLLGLTPRAEMVPRQGAVWFARLGPLGAAIRGLVLRGTALDPAVDEYRRALYATYARWHVHDLNRNWDPVEAKIRQIVDKFVVADRLGAQSGPLERMWLRGLWRGVVRPFML